MKWFRDLLLLIAGTGLLCGFMLLSPSGGGSYTGPGDVVSSASMWWGLRAYSAAQRGTKAVNLCNSGTCSDVVSDATTGIVPNAPTINGSACNNSTHLCTVAKLYDQTGGGNDFGQATAANQPAWNVSTIGSLPCIKFVGGGTLLTATITSVSQPLSTSAVAERSGTFTSQNVIIQNGTNFYFYFESTANQMDIYDGGSVASQTAADSAFHAAQGIYNGASSLINVDNSAGTTANVGGTATGVTLGMGATPSGTISLTGFICEAGIWPVAFSGGQQTSMNSNQHTYWGF